MTPLPENAAPGKVLTPAARHALEEAAAGRRAETERSGACSEEQSGPGGPEPTRYGDWERKGVAVDFLERPSREQTLSAAACPMGVTYC